MRGHEPIIAMRLRGTTPKIVFINDFPCQTSHDWHDPGKKYGQVWPPDHATVSTAGDDICGIDLRFVVGMEVIICSTNEDRAKALFNRAISFGAKYVSAQCVDPKNPHLNTSWTGPFPKHEVPNA